MELPLTSVRWVQSISSKSRKTLSFSRPVTLFFTDGPRTGWGQWFQQDGVGCDPKDGAPNRKHHEDREDRVGCTAGGTATPTKCPVIMSHARCIRQVWHMYASPVHSTQEWTRWKEKPSVKRSGYLLITS